VSIIIIRNGNASRVAASEFELESEMQKQLHANPGILPLHEIREGAELIAVVRELPVSAGYIDLLGFDAEGEVYVIETKLARNPDRRTVVTQALDYGAALWSGYAEPPAFFSAIDDLLTRAGAPRLADAMRAAHGGDDAAASLALDRIGQNLSAGAFRFVIPMDRIHDELKDLVRFINENSRFTVYLVELEQYQTSDVTVVVPRLFGAEARKTVTGSRAVRGKPGSDAEFRDDVERRVTSGELSASEADALRSILRIVERQDAQHNWMTSATKDRVSLSPRFPATGLTRSPFTLRSDGKLMLNVQWVAEMPAWHAWAKEILKLLGREDDERQFPSFRSSEWAQHAPAIVGLTDHVIGHTVG
jgi:hypothetical protein